MHRALLCVLSGLVWLASAAPAFAQVQVVDEPSRPVYVVNPDANLIAGVIGIGIINALLIALVWLQLGAIRQTVEKNGKL